MRFPQSTHGNIIHIATRRGDSDVDDDTFSRKASSHAHTQMSLPVLGIDFLMGTVSLHRMHLSCQSLYMHIDLIYQNIT